jgi:hypothetical protein
VEEEAILVAQLAHAAYHKVSSVDARQFAAKYASRSTGVLSSFASWFRGRAVMPSCAKDDGNDCKQVYAVPEGHSHGAIVMV